MRTQFVSVLACVPVLTAALAAQPATPEAPVNPYPVALYRMADVGKSMNLTPEQVANLDKLTERTQAQYRDDYAKVATLNETERAARIQELNRKYYADWNKGTADIFNDTQRARYQQLNYQYGGFNTLYDPDVQARLKLTPDQVKALRDHSDWSTRQLQEINRTGATDATKCTTMYRDYWTTYQTRLNTYLTPEQQKAWGTMVGDPYTFQPTFTPRR